MNKEFLVTAKDGRPLNEVTDLLLKKAGSLVDELAVFELVVGKATALGSGEPPLDGIKIASKIDQTAANVEDKLDQVISILDSISTELEIELLFEEK